MNKTKNQISNHRHEQNKHSPILDSKNNKTKYGRSKIQKTTNRIETTNNDQTNNELDDELTTYRILTRRKTLDQTKKTEGKEQQPAAGHGSIKLARPWQKREKR